MAAEVLGHLARSRLVVHVTLSPLTLSSSAERTWSGEEPCLALGIKIRQWDCRFARRADSDAQEPDQRWIDYLHYNFHDRIESVRMWFREREKEEAGGWED
jgi:hypothetical protein